MNGPQWICPECGTVLPIEIVIDRQAGSTIVRLDGQGVRDHVDMHERCYCQWVDVRLLCSATTIAHERQPDPSCPVHKDDDHRARVLTQRLAAGLDVPIELIQDTPPEEKA